MTPHLAARLGAAFAPLRSILRRLRRSRASPPSGDVLHYRQNAKPSRVHAMSSPLRYWFWMGVSVANFVEVLCFDAVRQLPYFFLPLALAMVAGHCATRAREPRPASDGDALPPPRPNACEVCGGDMRAKRWPMGLNGCACVALLLSKPCPRSAHLAPRMPALPSPQPSRLPHLQPAKTALTVLAVTALAAGAAMLVAKPAAPKKRDP
jgi:hypothetical protein